MLACYGFHQSHLSECRLFGVSLDIVIDVSQNNYDIAIGEPLFNLGSEIYQNLIARTNIFALLGEPLDLLLICCQVAVSFARSVGRD